MTWDGEERRKIPAHCQAEVLTRLTSLEEKQDTMHEANIKRMDKIIEFIEGNGKDGAKVRLASLEQISKALIFVTGTIVVALIGSWFRG